MTRNQRMFTVVTMCLVALGFVVTPAARAVRSTNADDLTTMDGISIGLTIPGTNYVISNIYEGGGGTTDTIGVSLLPSTDLTGSVECPGGISPHCVECSCGYSNGCRCVQACYGGFTCKIFRTKRNNVIYADSCVISTTCF